MISSFARETIIPPSAVQLIVDGCYNSCWSAFQAVLLPTFIYYATITYLASISIFSLMFFGDDAYWSQNALLFNLIKIIRWITRFHLVTGDIDNAIIGFWINIGVCAVLFIPHIIVYFEFRSKKKIFKELAYVYCFAAECLHPIWASVFPAHFGILIAYMVRTSDSGNAFIWFMVLADILLVYFNVKFIGTIVYSHVAYCKGRTWAWAGSGQTQILMIIYVCLIFSRMYEYTQDKSIKYLFLFLSYIPPFLVDFLAVNFNPCVDQRIHCYWPGTLLGSVASSTIIIISKPYITIDPLIPFILFIIFAFVFSFIAVFLVNRLSANVCAQIDLYGEGEFTVLELFKKYIIFVRALRIGFTFANPILLKWNICQEALEVWPDSDLIWQQWIKFLAIYCEENKFLEVIAQSYKEQKDHSTTISNFLMEVEQIIRSRVRFISPDIQVDLGKIAISNQHLRHMHQSFWKAVSENNAESSFTIANQAQNQTNDAIQLFSQVMSDYPNDILLVEAYAQFLKDLVFDEQLSRVYYKKAQFMRSTTVLYDDATSNFGFDIFPLIPKSLNNEHKNLIEDEIETALPGQQTQQYSTPETDDDPIDDSSLGKHSLEPNNQKTNVLFFILVIHCLLVLFGALVLPMLIVAVRFNEIKGLSGGMDSLHSISNSIVSAKYYIALFASQSLSTSLSDEEEMQLTGNWSQGKNSTIIISAVTTNLRNEISKFEQLYSDNSGFNDKIRHHYTSAAIPVISNNIVTSMPIKELLSSLTNSISLFSPSYEDSITSTSWFENIMKNSNNGAESITNFSQIILESINITLEEILQVAFILTCILASVSLLTLIPLNLILFSIKKQWTSFSQALRLIPKSSLLGVLAKLTTQKESFDQSNLNIFSQSFSGSFLSGIPIAIINIVYIFGYLAALIGLIVINTLPRSRSTEMKESRLQILSMANMLDDTYMLITDMRDAISTSLSFPLSSRTLTELAEEMIKLHTTANANFDTVTFMSNSISTTLFKGQNIINHPNSSAYVSLVAIYDAAQEYITKALNNDTFVKDDIETLKCFNIFTNFLSTFLTKTMNLNGMKMTNDIVQRQVITCVIVAAISLVASVFFFILMYFLIIRIRKAFSFGVLILNQFKSEIYEQVPALSYIIMSEIPANQEKKNYKSQFFSQIYSQSKEIIFVLKTEGIIIECNQAAEKLCELQENTMKGMQITSILTFSNPEVINNISSLNKCRTSSDIEVQKKLLQKAQILVDYSGSSSDAEVFLIIWKDEAQAELNEKIIEEKSKISKITNIAIPSRLKEFFVDQSLRCSRSFCYIIGIRLANYKDLSQDNDVDSLSESVKNFNSTISDIAEETEDCVLIKKLGITSFVCINSVHQSEEVRRPGQLILTFLKKLNAKCHEMGLAVSCSVSYTHDMICGRLSPLSILFSAYSPAIRESYFNLNLCKANHAAFSSYTSGKLHQIFSNPSQEEEGIVLFDMDKF